MDLVLTLDELQKARRYVSDGRDNVARQRKIVEWLEGQGHDALDAILFLEFLEELQEQYQDHRNRLERQVMRLVKPEDD
jgi:hypothetical protein